MKRIITKAVITLTAMTVAMISLAKPTISGVTARQRYPWNGLVDIVVTLQGDSQYELTSIECIFSATNIETQTAIPTAHIMCNGEDTRLDNVCLRRFIWDVKADIGELKADDVLLTVDAVVGVQLWENGPLWAKCNVGTTKPDECGYYFWWGDTVGYQRNADNDGWISVKDLSPFLFSSANCPSSRACDSWSQLRASGYIDSAGVLTSDHDAATAHLGAPWRMPTCDEMDALLKNCDRVWTTSGGNVGCLVKGRGAYATRCIFFPVTGYGEGAGFGGAGYAACWSSTPSPVSNARCLVFASDFVNESWINLSSDFCMRGRPVRPVRVFSDAESDISKGGVHLKLDCREGPQMASASGKELYYDVCWYADAEQVRITDNGMVVTTGTVGCVDWKPDLSSSGRHVLKLEAIKGGQIVATETAEFSCYLIRNETELVIFEGAIEIGDLAFAGGRFTTVTIPDSVTNIAPTAFAGCSNIVSAEFGTWPELLHKYEPEMLGWTAVDENVYQTERQGQYDQTRMPLT